jgi:uncharacterized protein YifN (PemK superfamily)
MSVTVIGLLDTLAVFEDGNGEARIDVHDIARLHTLADMSNDEHVTRLGRRYHRDTLGAVKRDFENGDMRVLDQCRYENRWYRCEAVATLAETRCARHEEAS